MPDRLADGAVTLRVRGKWLEVVEAADGGAIKRFGNGDTEVRWPDGRRGTTVRIDSDRSNSPGWPYRLQPASVSASVVGARCTPVLYAM